MRANLRRCSPGPWPSGHRSEPVPPAASRHTCSWPPLRGAWVGSARPRQPGRTGKWLHAQDRPCRWRFRPRRSHPTARIHYPRWSTSPFLDSSPFMGRYSGPGLPPRPFGKVTPWWTFVELSSPLVDPGPNLSNCAPWPAPPAGGASDPPGRTGQHGDRCGSHQPGRETRPAADTRRAANCRLDGAGRDNTVHVPCHHCCPPSGRL